MTGCEVLLLNQYIKYSASLPIDFLLKNCYDENNMSTTRKVAHNTLIQMGGKVISTLLGLIALGMLTRYLGKEQFGWYVTAISFLQFVGILIDFGLTPVTAQMMSEPRFDKKKLLQNLLGFRFTSAVFFLGLTPIVALLFPYPEQVKQAIILLTISFLAVAMNQVLIGYYQEQLLMKVQVIGEVLGRLVLVAGLWFLMAQNQPFLPIMAVVAASSIIYTLVLWAVAGKRTKATFGFDWEIWKAILSKSWPIAISIIFNVVYLRGDVILLSTFFADNLDIVGLYGAAYRAIDVLSQTAMMIMGVILPLLAFAWSRDHKEKFREQYQQAFDAMMAIAVPMTVGVILLAEPIMVLVAGEEFAAAGAPLSILSIAVFGVFFGAVFGHTAVAIDKQKQTMWVYMSNAIISLGAYLYFIPKFGMFGAAWVTVFSELYAGLLLFLVIRHYSKVKLKMFTFLKILLSAVVMAIVVLTLYELHVIALSIIGAAVYGVMLMATKTVSKETMSDILKFPS
jgi:O-antigen/teichoic acid export membrane protein